MIKVAINVEVKYLYSRLRSSLVIFPGVKQLGRTVVIILNLCKVFTETSTLVVLTCTAVNKGSFPSMSRPTVVVGFLDDSHSDWGVVHSSL